MGVLLSKPNTTKEFDEGENPKMSFAACSMQVFSTRLCLSAAAAPPLSEI